MDADNNQAGILVLFRPRIDVRKFAQTVDTRVSPEVDQHDLTAEGFAAQRGGVEPSRRAIQFGHPPFVALSRCDRDAADQRNGENQDSQSEKVKSLHASYRTSPWNPQDSVPQSR